VRIVIADDEVLLREGLARLLEEVGLAVVGLAADAPTLLQTVALERPDVALVDIRMPPTHTDEGLTAAIRIRTSYPTVGVLVLSHHLDAGYAMHLLEAHPTGVGYLLKERVSHVQVLVDALARIAAGESVVDPTIVARMLHRGPRRSRLDTLSDREREVVALMAEGRSNAGIAAALVLSLGAVEKHIASIFQKLRLPPSETDHRRVLAVLAYLQQH
jgi:DNA-binding NarL/FixJ family response regulator